MRSPKNPDFARNKITVDVGCVHNVDIIIMHACDVGCVHCGLGLTNQSVCLKWYCDENHIFPIEPILKHKQVACMTRKMLFTIFK